MVNKEDLEGAIVYSNICLKRWAREKTHLLNAEHVHSMVNGWIVRVLNRTPNTTYFRKKSYTKAISKALFVTFDIEKMCINSITCGAIILPNLDFNALNERSMEKLYTYYIAPQEVSTINFNTIETIKFN